MQHRYGARGAFAARRGGDDGLALAGGGDRALAVYLGNGRVTAAPHRRYAAGVHRGHQRGAFARDFLCSDVVDVFPHEEQQRLLVQTHAADGHIVYHNVAAA
ncbi:hypothetical protein SDC9_126250 [bioreactor metagenome]|uniref:Uncharacterized protein n=1 Tax=bioreactor metagenome TaxID=1076179 RepID=A0A645CQN2_9ZZZZ